MTYVTRSTGRQRHAADHWTGAARPVGADERAAQMRSARFLPRARCCYRPSAELPASYADAVLAGERIYLSAQSGARADGSIAAPGDAVAQANAAIDQLEA